MANTMRQPTPPNGIHPHHNMPPQHVNHVNGMPNNMPQKASPQHLQQLNEAVWLGIGSVSELMGDLDGAIGAYERALQHNQYSIQAMNQISCILRTKEQFPRAVEYLQAILKLDQNNGEVWGSLGHCFLMMEDLQQAYSAYQQALYHLKDPKEPKLWYGIGILYDRYGSLEHAEEAFSQVMRMEPGFEKANEIYFRLGIIYKQQQKFEPSLECFKYIVHDPPRPLTEEDIWFQIGHVHEQQKDYDSAKAAYRRVLERDPKHAKVLQQLGWLHHQESNSFRSQDQAIEYLEQSVSSDNNDAQSWYLLGRCYMSLQKYSKAYEAYQQAVYRDGRNPTFWCSIGVLYYQINQYRDALDAYSRAIRLNPYISEVWYDLGTLYESCNNQTNDALDAYQRAADLDPTNLHIKHRLQILRSGQASGVPPQHPAPPPQDVHPQQYQEANVRGPPGPQWGPAPVAQPAAQRPPPAGEGWGQQLAAIDNPQQRPPNPYESREAMRGQPPPSQAPPRQPSPRHDPMRPYQDQRGAPPRRSSPAPAGNHAGPNSYPLPQPSSGGQPQGPSRITNPNYAAAASLAAPPAGHSGPMPPPGRGQSPPPEIRPIVPPLEVKHSPSSHPSDYNRGGQTYTQPQPPIMQAPPVAALEAAEAAAQRGRDDRPPTGYKRGPDSEDEYNKGPNKKTANGEARPDGGYSHNSPRDTKQPTPPRLQRRSSSEIRREQANQNYHPSEAAHHPLPPPPSAITGAATATADTKPQEAATPQQSPVATTTSQQQQQQLPPLERPQEGAARKMDLDEDYDAGDDDKRTAIGQGKTSPGSMPNGQPKTEASS